jgi:signal transduction histidine kinase
MMHDFLSNNRSELEKRCRQKVAARPGRAATETQLRDGVPMFLDQLIRTLEVEQSDSPENSRRISGPSGGGAALSEVSVTAAQHGKDLLALGLTVDQVVHDYGDLCQAITDLAVERDVPFHVNEFRTLNRCLDNAISDAVTEFSYQRDVMTQVTNISESNIRMGFFAHELRNLLGTATLAFAAAKSGNLNLNGATGTILERSLGGLEKLIARSMDDLRFSEMDGANLTLYSLAEFLGEIYSASVLTAARNGCLVRMSAVEPELALQGGRDLLMAAVANLLQNAFKFTRPGTEVLLTGYASGDRIFIDVHDHCGGLAKGVAETMFLPFSQSGADRTGIGLGLTIAKQSVAAHGGELTVLNLPDEGCVFTISLPRHAVLS